MDEVEGDYGAEIPNDVAVGHQSQKRPQNNENQEEEKQEVQLDIGFLFTSPIVLENHFPGQNQELVEFPQISWKKELKLIKDEVRKKELAMKIECQVATT